MKIQVERWYNEPDRGFEVELPDAFWLRLFGAAALAGLGDLKNIERREAASMAAGTAEALLAECKRRAEPEP